MYSDIYLFKTVQSLPPPLLPPLLLQVHQLRQYRHVPYRKVEKTEPCHSDGTKNDFCVL